MRDHRGGGQASARETTSWVVAGSIVSQILNRNGISVKSYVSSIGKIDLDIHYSELNLDKLSKMKLDVRLQFMQKNERKDK